MCVWNVYVTSMQHAVGITCCSRTLRLCIVHVVNARIRSSVSVCNLYACSHVCHRRKKRKKTRLQWKIAWRLSPSSRTLLPFVRSPSLEQSLLRCRDVSSFFRICKQNYSLLPLSSSFLAFRICADFCHHLVALRPNHGRLGRIVRYSYCLSYFVFPLSFRSEVHRERIAKEENEGPPYVLMYKSPLDRSTRLPLVST